MVGYKFTPRIISQLEEGKLFRCAVQLRYGNGWTPRAASLPSIQHCRLPKTIRRRILNLCPNRRDRKYTTAMNVMVENTKDWKSSVLVRILLKNNSASAEMQTHENPTTRV